MALGDCWHEAMGPCSPEKNGNLDFYEKATLSSSWQLLLFETITRTHGGGPRERFCGLDSTSTHAPPTPTPANWEQDVLCQGPLREVSGDLALEMKQEGEDGGKRKLGGQRQSQNRHMWH